MVIYARLQMLRAAEALLPRPSDTEYVMLSHCSGDSCAGNDV